MLMVTKCTSAIAIGSPSSAGGLRLLEAETQRFLGCNVVATLAVVVLVSSVSG